MYNNEKKYGTKFMFIDKNKIEDLILELGLVSQDDFALAKEEVEETGLPSYQILLKKGAISENELQSLQMKATGVSFIDLGKLKIDSDILSIIPEPIVRQYGVIAFAKDDKNLKIALLDLDNLEKIDFLKRKVGLRIIPYLTDKVSLNKAVVQYQELLKKEYGAMIQEGSLSFQTISEDALNGLSRESILELARSKQVNHVFELLLRHALIQNASSVHIEPQEDNVLIRYRISGYLHSAMFLPKRSAVFLIMKIKTLASLRLDTREICQDGRFSLGFDGKEVDFRVHIIPTFWGEKMVLNILQTGDAGFSLEAVGFHGRALDLLYKILNKRKKMILIAGSKQSGKTTTFYTLLDLLKNPNLNIATLENSIGFQMSGISQIVTKPEIGFDILDGVTHLSKQDCDAVAVDEIKDLGSNNANKSFLQLASLANDDRLISAVVEIGAKSSAEVIRKLVLSDKINPILIINSLEIVILQKLIPRISDEKQEYYLNVSEIKRISRSVDLEKVMNALVDEKILPIKKSWSEIRFFKSVIGKNNSKIDAKNGQIMMGEVLKVSLAIKELLKEGAPVDQIEKQARDEGMLTLKEEILFRAVQGLVSVEEIL